MNTMPATTTADIRETDVVRHGDLLVSVSDVEIAFSDDFENAVVRLDFIRVLDVHVEIIEVANAADVFHAVARGFAEGWVDGPRGYKEKPYSLRTAVLAIEHTGE